MKNFRIFLILVIGIAAIRAAPTIKQIPKQAENKTVVAETKLADKGSPGIAVENAEEPKQGDRAKKSAATTFCVEIRPGASDPPHKYCDPPVPQSDDKPPPQHDEVHDHPSPPVQTVETEVPVYVVPPNDVAIYDSYLQPVQPAISFIPPQQPSIPCSPQQPGITYPIQPQFPPSSIFPSIDQLLIPQITAGYPYRPPPCLPPYPWSPWGFPSIQRPHAQISFFRSADGTPMKDSASSPSESTMEMKSVADDKSDAMESSSLPTSGADSETMPMGTGENVGTPMERSFFHKIGGILQPSPSTGCQGTTQIVIPQYRPPISGGCGSGIHFPYGRQNDQGLGEGALGMKSSDAIGSMAMGESRMGMDMGQAKTHVYHPTMIGPMMSSMGTLGYQPSPMIYQPLSGYQGRFEPYKTFSLTSGGYPLYRKDQNIRRQAEQKEQEPKDNQMEQKLNQPTNPMTPSQILNQMRSFDSQRMSPMMHSFSRDEDQRNEPGSHINITIPPSGKPVVTGGVMRNSEEKNLEISKSDEVSKNETEGPTTDDEKP